MTTPDEAQALLPVTPDEDRCDICCRPRDQHVGRDLQCDTTTYFRPMPKQSHSLPGDREAVASALHKKACGLLPTNAIGPIEDERSFWLSLADAALTPSALSGDAFGLTDDEAWEQLVNFDDRTSPDEYPDMALITREELSHFMRSSAVCELGDILSGDEGDD